MGLRGLGFMGFIGLRFQVYGRFAAFLSRAPGRELVKSSRARTLCFWDTQNSKPEALSRFRVQGFRVPQAREP